MGLAFISPGGPDGRGTTSSAPPARPRTPPLRIVPALVGLLLLTAATLKLLGFDPSSASRLSLLSSPSVQTATVAWELGLGLWLLSGLLNRLAWVFAFATFAVFAAVSAWLTWTGVARCGCLGEVAVAPHWMLTLDVVVLSMLVVKRPAHAPSVRRAEFVTAAMTLTLFGTLFIASRHTGVDEAVLNFVSGTALKADHDVADMGSLEPGQIATQDVTLVNVSSDSVRLVGGTIDCSTMVSETSAIILPGQSATVTVHFRVANDASSGAFSRGVEVWTDSASQPIVRLSLVCSVAPKR